MESSLRVHLAPASVLFALIVGSFASTARAVDGQGASDGVPLHLIGVLVRPDHKYVLAIRTCQPRGISQGQILVRRPTAPLPEIRRVKVFSLENDASTQLVPTDDTSIFTSFVSPSATVNAHHGPLLAVLLAPEVGLVPGDTFAVVEEASSIELLDSSGQPTPFETFNGTVTVCAPDAPYVVAVRDAQGAPGQQAVIGVEMHEFARYRHAHFVLHYDPSFFTRILSTVVWDVRGDVASQIDIATPGEITMTLDSPSGWIGVLPGSMVDVTFGIVPTVQPGDSTIFEIASDSAQLVNRSGNSPQLDLRSGTLTIVSPTP
ncbi:MAG: hypothetical protein HYR85_07525 [Planctomycetes bacterium]|nr:hypothetical protein [Planctomycetota bacterium]MBI3848057.1 hypothetical protein [Planctomycetota bacterium]